MIDEVRLLELMADLESASVERTKSVSDIAKFSEAVCAFANDLVNSKSPGFLLVGVDDKSGRACGLKVTDQLLQILAGLGTDGNILPAPAITTYKIALTDGSGEVAVVEVKPSDLPPVRYKGLVRIRRGPRKGIANESEERLLAERRVAGALTFDATPCAGSTIADLALDLFTVTYRPIAIDAEVILGSSLEVSQHEHNSVLQ
ncbi:MAG: putative DNA binding domain-containing protein [Pirellulaceae bacterium]|nr:putative DNA binding domain-containing protein [Planctomycetales bacterium]